MSTQDKTHFIFDTDVFEQCSEILNKSSIITEVNNMIEECNVGAEDKIPKVNNFTDAVEIASNFNKAILPCINKNLGTHINIISNMIQTNKYFQCSDNIQVLPLYVNKINGICSFQLSRGREFSTIINVPLYVADYLPTVIQIYVQFVFNISYNVNPIIKFC